MMHSRQERVILAAHEVQAARAATRAVAARRWLAAHQEDEADPAEADRLAGILAAVGAEASDGHDAQEGDVVEGWGDETGCDAAGPARLPRQGRGERPPA